MCHRASLKAASTASAPEFPKKTFFFPLSRHERSELRGQVDLGGVVEVGARHVEEPVGLVLYGFHDPWVAVARGAYRDACREVEEEVAVRVLDPEAPGLFRHEGIGPRVGG